MRGGQSSMTYGGAVVSLSILSNSASLRAQRILGRSSDQLATTLTRLSSGERINRASDDAAGLAISESLKVRAKVSAKGIRNTEDGLSALNIGDSALDQISNVLGRMGELAEQSANGTLSSTQRGTLNKEFRALGLEIQRISRVTTFNGVQLIAQQANFDVFEFGPVNSETMDLPANYTVYAKSPASLSENSITLQIGYDSSAASRITTDSINVSLYGLGLGGYYRVENDKGANLGIAEYLDQNIRTVDEARTSLTSITNALTTVSNYRGKLGATQSRLATAINGLTVGEESFLAANSRIRSADFADESANLTRLTITQNAATAVLAQANQQPALALTLLRS